MLLEFKDYFEDATYLKCWHNYGFDRHVMKNTGIDCKGFGGDTMHMARLADASRMPNQYALAALSEILEVEIEETKQEIINVLKGSGVRNQKETIAIYEEHCRKTRKVNLKETFGFYR